MDVFSRKKVHQVAVIGLGSFGDAVGRELTALGDRVLGVDSDGDRVSALAGNYDSIIQLDAREESAIREIGLEDYDAVIVAIGKDAESSVFVTMNVLDRECPRVWVKAQSSIHERILRRVGAHHVFLPEAQFGRHVAQLVHNPYMLGFMELDSDHQIARLAVPKDYIGRDAVRVTELCGKDLSCLAVIRGGVIIRDAPEREELREGDELIVHGLRATLRHLTDRL